MNDATHRHYVCTNCREIFCTAKPEYAGMVDGSGCPECHIATVVAVNEIPSGPGDALEHMLTTLPEFMQQFRDEQQQVIDLRERQVVALERIVVLLEQIRVWGQLPRGG